MTQTTYAQTGVIRRAVIEINDERFDFADITNLGKACDDKYYDLTAVITHEAGHFVGLDHTNVTTERARDAPTMSLVVGVCELDKISLEDDDIAGFCLLYPRGLLSGNCYPLPPTTSVGYVTTTPF